MSRVHKSLASLI